MGNAADLLRAVDADPPDLVIVDVRMPPDIVDEGIHAALHILRAWPAVAVIVLSKHINTIFSKLDIAPDSTFNRRVLAVLAYLRDG